MFFSLQIYSVLDIGVVCDMYGRKAMILITLSCNMFIRLDFNPQSIVNTWILDELMSYRLYAIC